MNEKTYILAIDTTTPDTGIGLKAAGPDSVPEGLQSRGEGALSESETHPSRRLARRGEKLTKIKTWISEHNQSQELLPKIDQLLRTNRIKPMQIKWVAVNLGPGSFTGLRVGISTANAFGYALQIPVVGTSKIEGTITERIQTLFRLVPKTKKFRQILPVYGSLPHITKPRRRADHRLG